MPRAEIYLLSISGQYEHRLQGIFGNVQHVVDLTDLLLHLTLAGAEMACTTLQSLQCSGRSEASCMQDQCVDLLPSRAQANSLEGLDKWIFDKSNCPGTDKSR